jgi:dihydrodipicolinate synthase/N-acetylneuraminate lyase
VVNAKLNRETLKGVWPALLTPWSDDDQLDETRLASEIEFFARSGVHGTYTGGTAGEFYAQDDATFEQLTKTACREAHRVGLLIQIGCTALNTRTVQNRIRTAIECGADGIQFALPFWLALSDREVEGFFGEIAEVAGTTPLILYQTMRAKRRVDPPLIGKLSREFPTFIGVKDTGSSYEMLESTLTDAPRLSVFGTDIDLLERMRHGGRGSYSSVAGLNASLMLAIYHHCAAGRFELAEPLQDAVRRVMNEVLHPIGQEEGLMDSALDRLQRMAGGGNVGLRCRLPYRSASESHLKRLLHWCAKEVPMLLRPVSIEPR